MNVDGTFVVTTKQFYILSLFVDDYHMQFWLRVLFTPYHVVHHMHADIGAASASTTYCYCCHFRCMGLTILSIEVCYHRLSSHSLFNSVHGALDKFEEMT